MKRRQFAFRGLIVVGAILAVTYALDCVLLLIHKRHATSVYPLESMTRARLLQIPMKNGTNTFEIDEVNPTEVVTCVHAIFPHSGAQPCWYLKPRLNQPIKIGGLTTGGV